MSIEKAITASLSGEQLSYTITSTSKVDAAEVGGAPLNLPIYTVTASDITTGGPVFPCSFGGIAGNIIGSIAALIYISLFD